MKSESKLFEKINSIYKELKIFADEYKIISRVELREKIKDLLQEIPLIKDDKKFLEENYDSTPINYLFLGSIKEIPDSINAPSLIEHINYKDITFYYGHTFGIDEKILEQARKRVYKFKNEKMRKILDTFLNKSDYEPAKIISDKRKILAIKGNSQYVILVYPSILILNDEIKDLSWEENLVFAVPTGISPGPYLNFYKINANKILLNKDFVWIVDIEDESVSPFVGYPKDKDLNSNFKSSQLARYASRVISMDIEDDF
ncbi:MAG: hypothetical protein HWN67_13295 [Candidatus Helarchaeota archaeon]|nr:hypothetical protein [Candidatus Helarchaeota archaeon]